MSKQLTFENLTDVIKVYPDGRREKLRYGKYEAVMITEENGFSVDRTRTLSVPRFPVTEVTCDDGTKLLFEKPLYFIEQSGYGTGLKLHGES